MNFVKDKFKKIGNVVSKTITQVKHQMSTHQEDQEEKEESKGNHKTNEPIEMKSLKGNDANENHSVPAGEPDEDLLDLFPLDQILQFDTAKLPGRIRIKVENFQKILTSNKIDIKKLKDQCFNGIPEDCPGLRSIVWRLVLELIPNSKEKWAKTMDSSRETYKMLANKYIYQVESPPEEVWIQQDKDETEYYLNKTREICTQPKWVDFFKDRDQWVEVEKDTTRTRSEMHFFVTKTQREDGFDNPYKRKKLQSDKPEEKHFDVLSRILFVFAKTNNGIKYVQGMNEILAVLYHVFLSDKQFAEHVEADCFFAFTILMGEVRDCFIKVLDDSDSGIKARVTNLNNLLKKVDEPLWQALEDMGLNPHFYSLRWLMLIFTQEFEIFDVMRLWDSYLSHSDRQGFLDFICISILTIQRDHIMNDFAEAMESLQRIQHLDIVEIVILADQLYRQHAKVAKVV